MKRKSTPTKEKKGRQAIFDFTRTNIYKYTYSTVNLGSAHVCGKIKRHHILSYA